MEQLEYRTMYDLENHYWWFVARRALVVDMVQAAIDSNAQVTKVGVQTVNVSIVDSASTSLPRILDVGCGTGANLQALQACGQAYGVDLAPEAVRFCQQRGLTNLAISRIETLPYQQNAFDLITALDVLEHIDNDLAAMQELYRICKPGGRLLVTVPAYGFLWSEHDEALHHRRRYAAYELRNKLTLAGFQIERCSYFIMLLFLPILIIRVIQGIFKHSTSPRTSHIQLPKIINQTLIWLLAIEKWLVRYINLPLGVSIVCLAQKPLGAEVTSSRTNVISLPAFRERVAPRH